MTTPHQPPPAVATQLPGRVELDGNLPTVTPGPSWDH